MSNWYPQNATLLGQSWGKYGLELKFQCPICGKDNLWYNPARKAGQCFSCERGWFESGMRRLFGEEQSHLEVWNELHDHRPTRKLKGVKHEGLEDSPLALWFLTTQRRCKLSDLKRGGVFYEEEKDRVCFPLQRADGQGAGSISRAVYMSRSTDPTQKGWLFESQETSQKDLFWYNPCGHRPYEKTTVIVEGPFDVLTPGLLGCAIAICGVKLSEYHEDALRTAKRVFIWLDADTAGTRAARFKLLRQIPNSSMIVYPKEPGDCTPEEARKVLRRHISNLTS